METLSGVPKITSFESFCSSIIHTAPVLSDALEMSIRNYCDNERNQLVLPKYVSAFERVLKDNQSSSLYYPMKKSRRDTFVECILGILCDVSKHCRLSGIVSKINKKVGSNVAYYEKESFKISKDERKYKKIVKQFIEKNIERRQ